MCLALAAAVSVSACQFFGPSTSEMTLAVQNQVLNTEIAAIRATATVEADRMMVTLEHAQTAVNHVDGQTQDLQATLVARNGLPADLNAITPAAELGLATPPPILDLGQNNNGVAPIGITPGATSAPSIPQQGNPALVITPNVTAAPTGPLNNIVTASSVGSDDCALNPTTSFTTATPEIYVVARAVGIGPSDSITSRWLAGGSEVVSYDWTPSFEIEDACIWFYIDQSEIAFTPGNWQVQMELNGQAVGSPVNFTIAESSAPGDAMLEGALGGAGNG
jgi:hypothetical protein